MPRPRRTQPIGRDTQLFGERLRELRNKRGATLEEVCDAAAMSVTYLSDLERGMKVPSLRTMIRLAAVLDCKVSALVSVFDREELAKLLRE